MYKKGKKLYIDEAQNLNLNPKILKILKAPDNTQIKTEETEEYCRFLLNSEIKIRAFFLRLLHESIKLYDDIAPKIKEKDHWYGKDDLWSLIIKITELSSCREAMMGDFYNFDY
jgi:hypothetical protein